MPGISKYKPKSTAKNYADIVRDNQKKGHITKDEANDAIKLSQSKNFGRNGKAHI